MPQSAVTGLRHGKKVLLVAAGVALLSIGAWLLGRDEAPAMVDVQPVAATPEARESAPAPEAEAILALAVTPWGEVFVDGKREGVSPPLNELKLPAGKHVVEIKNPGFVSYSATIELQAGTNQKIKHKFN